VDTRPTRMHCPYCSPQCGITLTPAGSQVHLEPQDEFPTNRGGLAARAGAQPSYSATPTAWINLWSATGATSRCAPPPGTTRWTGLRRLSAAPDIDTGQTAWAASGAAG